MTHSKRASKRYYSSQFPGAQLTTNMTVGKGAFQMVSPRVVNQFARDLAILQRARLPLIDSIVLLVNEQPNQAFAKILTHILRRLKGGTSLSVAMQEYDQVFDDVFRNLVSVGEVSGKMAEILERLASYRDKMADLKRKLLQALTYPGLVLGVAVAAVVFILLVVLPTFAEVFREFNASLPAPTRFLIAASNWLKSYWLLLLVTFGAGLLLFRQLRSRKPIRYFLDGLYLSLPILGPLVQKNLIGQFCRTLETLLECGISLLDALSITAESTTNSVLKKAVLEMREEASGGGGLAGALKNGQIIPAMVVQMITIGEETAEMPFMLGQIGDWYDREIDRAIELVSTVLEPVIIIFLGLVIGAILISIYLPLFNMANMVR